jgi:hypothetical protein
LAVRTSIDRVEAIGNYVGLAGTLTLAGHDERIGKEAPPQTIFFYSPLDDG